MGAADPLVTEMGAAHKRLHCEPVGVEQHNGWISDPVRKTCLVRTVPLRPLHHRAAQVLASHADPTGFCPSHLDTA